MSSIWNFCTKRIPGLHTYVPPRGKNRMLAVGDLSVARNRFLTPENVNLRYLIRSRFDWINQFVNESSKVVELGCGIGASKQFLKCSVELTDVAPQPWNDAVVDACKMPYGDCSLDGLVIVNALHHLPYPLLFFQEATRVLKKGGYIFIHEPHPSFLFLAALRLMRHEGWSFGANPFDLQKPINDQDDPWSGNNAISSVIFDRPDFFHARCPQLSIELDEFRECFIFLVSGGVSATYSNVNFSENSLKRLEKLDSLLIKIAPNIFAWGRRILIRKL